MKNLILNVIFSFFILNFGFAQEDQIPSVNTIATSGSWASAVEVRNVIIDTHIFSALYTTLSNSSEIDSVVMSSSYISYRTGYQDLVYFVIAQNPENSKVLTVSRIKAENIGMIKRLDDNLYQAARYYKSCTQTGKENYIFKIFAGFENKFYYTLQKGQYSRCYINQNVDAGYSIGSYKESRGYLVIPPNVNSLGMRIGSYAAMGYTKSISITIQTKVIKGDFAVVENDGFLLGSIFSSRFSPGTYTYLVEFRNGAFTNFDRFKVWFDCFGNDMIEPINIDVNGTPQIFFQSRPISELIIPK